ncbi:MAG: hypothetical protein ACRDMI_03695, partial [Streptosporangiaceae bacterium]
APAGPAPSGPAASGPAAAGPALAEPAPQPAPRPAIVATLARPLASCADAVLTGGPGTGVA